MVFPVAIVLVIANVLILSWPRTYFRDASRMVKFDANIDAVSLRQSVHYRQTVLYVVAPRTATSIETKPFKT